MRIVKGTLLLALAALLVAGCYPDEKSTNAAIEIDCLPGPSGPYLLSRLPGPLGPYLLSDLLDRLDRLDLLDLLDQLDQMVLSHQSDLFLLVDQLHQ